MSITTAAVAAAVLAAAPAEPPEFAVHHVEVTPDPAGARVVAYDEDGAVIGMLAVWSEDDGYVDATVTESGPVIDGTLAAEVAAERATIMMEQMSMDDQGVGGGPQKGYLGCGVGIISTTYSCFTINPLCPLVALATTCACVPLFEPTLNECL